MNKLIKKSINNQGVAIILVMGAVTILSYLLVDFTFQTKVNKLKVYNTQDRTQAKLNAEAGVTLAMSKLRLYQAGINLLNKNKDLKKNVGPGVIEKFVTTEFFYPLEVLPSMAATTKSAILEANKTSLVKGRIAVTIAPVSGFLNPNNLVITPKKKKEGNGFNDPEENKEAEKTPQEYIEEKIVETLTKEIDKRREEDDTFNEQYSNLKPELLVKELKFFVNKKESYDEPEKGEIQGLYNEKEITPKHAPFSSIDELYQLAGWDDTVVNLIKDSLSVHEVTIIPVNTITSSELRVLFPDITKDQVEEFFKYRDGDKELKEAPNEFTGPEDFKTYIVSTLGVMDEVKYEERIKQFKNAGLVIGVASKLFKIESTGVFGRSTYTITAFIDLPHMPSPPPPPKKKDDPNKIDPDNPDTVTPPVTDPTKKEEEKKEEEEPVQLLTPRIVEIRI